MCHEFQGLASLLIEIDDMVSGAILPDMGGRALLRLLSGDALVLGIACQSRGVVQDVKIHLSQVSVVEERSCIFPF